MPHHIMSLMPFDVDREHVVYGNLNSASNHEVAYAMTGSSIDTTVNILSLVFS